MNRILVVGLGGTIGSIKKGSITLDSPFKILSLYQNNKVRFEQDSPFTVFSENLDFGSWSKLIDYLNAVPFDQYDGVILLHGSDTLAFTAAVIANIFYDKTIILVASDKPPENQNSNGLANFERAVDFILEGAKGVYVSYDRLYRGRCITSANDKDEFLSVKAPFSPIPDPTLHNKNILVITPYVGMDYHNYNLEHTDAVLHAMYHSATAPKEVNAFIRRCNERKIPFYFVTSKQKAEYETAQSFENIIFESTLENAYARLLLTK